MRQAILGCLVLGLGLAQPALAAEETPEKANEARNCVQIVRLRQSHILDDQTIVFEMRGNEYYRNDLPNRCPRLGFERAFTYATSITQLCNVDIITVLQNFGGSVQPGASCGLGKFVPITKEEFVALRKEKRSKKSGSKDQTEESR